MSDSDKHATSVGQTGGLPGDNADPRAKQLTDDELADTVSMADVSSDDDAEDDGGDAGVDGEPGPRAGSAAPPG